MEKNPFIRTIYLYLFTLVGLILVVIGSAGLVNLGLRSYVFTKADEDERISIKQPTYAPISLNKVEGLAEGEAVTLSEEERMAVENWLADYEIWRNAEETRDYVGARRSRDVSQNLAFIIVGFPLYLYHWSLIKKDRKENERK
jgi:hypothetical protein